MTCCAAKRGSVRDRLTLYPIPACDTVIQRFDGHLRYALPFLHAAVEEHHQFFGDEDPWVYGVKENRHTPETLVSYSHEQGLIPRAYDLSELFAEETWATSRN